MSSANKKKPIGVDMDGVLANFTSGFYDHAWRFFPTFYSRLPQIEQVSEFYIEESIKDITEYERSCARKIVDMEGLFLGLEPYFNAKEGLNLLKELSGRDVYLVSAPHKSNPHSYSEKSIWVQKHLGEEWLENLILTRDKTVIDLSILIDDKPDPIGQRSPSWEHVLFNRSYNKNCTGKMRMFSWTNEEVEKIVEYIKEKE